MVEAVGGDTEAARKTQEEQAKLLYGVACSVPIVGHTIGGVQYALGQDGRDAMVSASRTTGVILGGVGGFVVGGPAGAAAGGICGGALVDSSGTTIDLLVNKENAIGVGNGATLMAIDQKVSKNENISGEIFDVITTIAMDGVAGAAAGEMAAKYSEKFADTARAYRVLEAPEADVAVKQQTLPKSTGAGSGPTGETCITESVKHTKQYLPQKQATFPNENFKAIQMDLPKKFMENTMKDAIPQQGSRATNAATWRANGTVKNIYTTEKLAGHPLGKKNLNIKTPNLPEFQNNISKVKVINPDALQYKNGFTKGVARMGKTVGGAVAVGAVCNEGATFKEVPDKNMV